MRIAHVVSTYPPYHGGMGNVAREIAERTARGENEVVVVTAGVQSAKCRVQNERSETLHSAFCILHSRPMARVGNAAWCPSIRRIVEDAKPDVVHLHWPFIGGIAPVLAWRQKLSILNSQFSTPPRRLVVHYHMDLLARGWRGAVFAAYQRWTLPRVLAAADRIVVSSLDYARHGALARYERMLGDRLMEIPLGVDTKRFHANAECIVHSAELRVLFVGGLDRAHAFKGVSVLLEAVARVPKVRLSVVGDGDLRALYEARVRVLGIADRVTFLGAVSDGDLPGAYRSADVAILPSTARSEAFGVVLLEAMASGVPVIASDLPGVRTVVADGVTGLLVPAGDVAALATRIAEYAADRDHLQAMGVRARQRVVERYDWDGIVQQWTAEYQRVCA